jgi:branched-chain amino acid transport system substrate-binding protein
MVKLSFIAILISMLSAQGSFAKETGVTDTEVIVGAHTAESGAFAIFAPSALGAAAYFDYVNENGGVHGRKIKWIRVDTQGQHVKSVQAVRKLVEQDGVFAIVAGMGPPHQAVYKYLIEQKVPSLFFADGLLEYNNPVKKTIIQGVHSFYSEGYALGAEVGRKHKGKTACTLTSDNAMGEELYKGALDALTKANATLKDDQKIKIGLVERVDRNAAQANTQMLSLKKAACDVVFNLTLANIAPKAITYAFSQGFKPAWYVGSGNVLPKFFELVPKEVSEGVVSVMTYAVSPGAKVKNWALFEGMMKKNNIPISRSSGMGFMLAEHFVETLKRAGKDLTRENVITAAESLGGFQCSICLAPAEYSATNHVPFSKPALIATKDGKWVLL